MSTKISKFELSVIIPTYNRSELLFHTLSALTQQSVDKSLFEVIVSDDGSADDTKAVCYSFSETLNIKYIFQEDKGYRTGSARNLGIINSAGKICLFLDSGILLGSDGIENHINFHLQATIESSAIGYVYGFEENDDLSVDLKQLVTSADVDASIKKLSINPIFSDIRESHYKKYNYDIGNLPAPWFYFWGCHVSVLKKNLDHVFFDENYDGRWGVEDNDLGFRLHENGIEICLLKEAKSIHYPHEKNKETRHLEGLENCMYFNDKFKTLETQLFLENYLDEELVDINELSIKKRKNCQK